MRFDKIVCVGLYKTGTSTLAEALRILGLNVCPESVGYKNTMLLEDAIDTFDAFEDYPWFVLGIANEVCRLYPNTGIILTSRCEDTWFPSFARWLDRNVHLPNKSLQAVFEKALDPLDKSSVVSAYRLHNDLARHSEYSNFIELDWEAGDGWEKLCRFLDVPVPDRKFPHMLKYDPHTDDYVNES